MKVAHNQVPKQAPVKAGKSARDAKGCDAKKERSAQDIILGLLAESAGMGEESFPREHLTRGTGLADKTVRNNLTKLKAKGWVEFDSQVIRLTASGRASSGAMENVPMTNAELHERIKINLKGKPLELFELMQDGEVHEKDMLAQKLGYEDKMVKAFKNVISTLSGRGLVQYPDPSSAQLSDKAFRFGRG
jgi:hypothetical protein